MSYVSLLKNIPELLSQPTGIAAIASLGIHGAIALIVPLMPVDANKSKEATPKPVGVLELSQEDQSRLPQTSDPNQLALQPQTQLPSLQQQFPQQPQLTNPPNLNGQTGVLPPLPPPINSSIALPPIATAPGNYRITSLPQGQPLQMTPRRDFRFDNSGFNADGKKLTPTTPPSFNEREVVPEASKPLPVDRLPELNAGKIPEDLPENPSATPTPSTTEPNNDGSLVANQPQVAPIGETPKVGDNLAFSGENIPKWQQGSTIKTPELPVNRSETGLVAQVNSYESLRKALQQEYPSSQEKAVIRGTVPIDKPGIDGTVLGFLVVDTEGKVLDIKFQDKSVSPELQLKAREYFIKNAPKGGRQISRYPFSLRFQNNANNTVVDENKTPAVVIPKQPTTPLVNGNQPAPSPVVPLKPLRQQLQPSKKESTPTPTPTPETTIQPTPEPTTSNSNSELSSSLESSQKLLERLREARQQQQQRQGDN
ncbi:hypothetical protein [Nostoc sp. TCL26-01]|uniref:hypothetical protein n=1 Tax=Nostoc sp. TCL26-01 TaxID=2576904 RepID=UPI0015BD913E|nr:hypothetical protein [Nostoc sp. TCL26-01]QLE55318.1 hypothetical protein FD725_07205 [Nostoc sp. TCL26-01]